MRVGIVGFGYMGRARLDALRAMIADGADIDVVGVFDPNVREIPGGGLSRVPPVPDLDALLALDPDWVIIASPHRVAAESCRRALLAGAQVLMEKPMGRDLQEAQSLAASQVRDGQLCVGLNYRFFDGVGRLLQDLQQRAFGPLVSASLLMGHGHQPGMERSWKLNPEEAGAGVLTDPGIHVLDLARLMAGDDLAPVSGLGYRGFWRTGVDEECHLLLRASSLPIVSVQLSIVRWRSTFRIEVFGTDGYGIVEGRDRSYGQQTYRVGRRWGWRAGLRQRETEILVCRADEGKVFERELRALLVPGEDVPLPPADAGSTLATMRLIDACQQIIQPWQPDLT